LTSIILQLWDEVLKSDPTPSYSRKAIYQLWSDQTCKNWKRDPDEVKSAKILLDEASKPQLGQKGLYVVQPIPLHEEPGFTAIAFALPEVLRQWGGRIREVALDSAWNTNGSRFEVYALLGEIYGSGCPMGYILIQTSDEKEAGGKERYLTELLSYFKTTWKIKALVTLTDKDISEINAFLKVYPEAKYQLCFWHCLRALKTRLSILRRRPKYYDIKEAMKEFDWIEETFVPIAQSKETNSGSNTYIATKAIPHLKIRLGGVLQNTAPVQAPASPHLTIRLNGIVQSVVPLPKQQKIVLDENEDITNEHDSTDGGDLSEKVEQFISKDIETDAEDGPDWMFEEGEVKSNDPNHVFCPAPHRKQILHLFTKHFCQHPLFAEHDGKWTAEQIRSNAVYEMYSFCHTRGLREVWGYLWACWYSPKMWKLWARSTSPILSRLRTTMGVENFWRQLKHDYLHHVARPRLDHLVWILINKVTPAYIARAEIMNDSYRLGRSKQLTTYQKYFKSSWKKLSERTISDKEYHINVEEWTCTCGQQKYNCHHICKHLVQAVNPPEKRFWREVVRRRTLPIYQHPALTAKGLPERVAYVEPDGSISDGDDHIWSGDHNILKGGGGWRKTFNNSEIDKVLGKRQRESTEITPNSQPPPNLRKQDMPSTTYKQHSDI
jgi:MULE transposase domain